MTAIRFFLSVFMVLTLFSSVNAQDQVAGHWSLIFDGMGYSDSGGDEGGSSLGTEDGGTDFGSTGGDNVTDMPVDGGLSLLLAAGAAFGARRLRRRRREEDRS